MPNDPKKKKKLLLKTLRLRDKTLSKLPRLTITSRKGPILDQESDIEILSMFVNIDLILQTSSFVNN